VGSLSLAIVCDGVGGLASGELASATVVHRLAQWFDDGLRALLRVGELSQVFERVQDAWCEMLSKINADIRTFAIRNGQVIGTTFTGMLIFNGEYLVCQVGDCRAYEIKASRIIRLTEDQTFANYHLARGLMTAEELEQHPQRKMLMQSVGTQDVLEPVFSRGLYDEDAVYVLCCDGIYRRLAEGELAHLFGESSRMSRDMMHERCARVAWNVLERGERDNVTIVAFTAGREDDA
jgi:serine/threonine protein phosphatase PrpC